MMPIQAGGGFLNTLIIGTDSVTGSPLWPPSPSDSGISLDPHSDQIDSPSPSRSPPLETGFLQSLIHNTQAPVLTQPVHFGMHACFMPLYDNSEIVFFL